MPAIEPLKAVRDDFPFLQRQIDGRAIAYLDNAGTTQKPRPTASAVLELYESGISNVHRAVSFLSEDVTRAFEEARETMARLIGSEVRETIFVANATQGIDLVCRGLTTNRRPRVLTTTLEHHSNLVPWMQRADVEFIDWSPNGGVDLDDFSRRLRSKPDLIAIARSSNFLGVLHPVQEIVLRSKEIGVPVLVDASQSVAHEANNVRELGCDYMVFSGHKMYGPSGVGVLYVSEKVLDQMQPVVLGGGMVKEVSTNGFVPNDLPYRFEAGTPNIEGVIGLGAAAKYLLGIGLDAIGRHECGLIQYAKRELSNIAGLKTHGPRPGEACAPLVSFQVKELDSAAVARTLSNRAAVIVRSGFHCAQPAHNQLGLGPTVRASLGVYNTEEDIDRMVDVVKDLCRLAN